MTEALTSVSPGSTPRSAFAAPSGRQEQPAPVPVLLDERDDRPQGGAGQRGQPLGPAPRVLVRRLDGAPAYAGGVGDPQRDAVDPEPVGEGAGERVEQRPDPVELGAGQGQRVPGLEAARVSLVVMGRPQVDAAGADVACLDVLPGPLGGQLTRARGAGQRVDRGVGGVHGGDLQHGEVRRDPDRPAAGDPDGPVHQTVMRRAAKISRVALERLSV